MSDDIVRYFYLLDDSPWRAAVLIPRGQHDGISTLRGRPVVLENIAVDDDTLAIFELQQIFHDPGLAAPRWLLRDLVVTDENVGRHEVRHRRIAAAEYHILAGGLQIVVDNAVWPRPVLVRDGLRIFFARFDVRNVRV